MKIGILTFHSQLNYGGVLQCWALQTALEQMGHDVVVIDRWMGRDNSLLRGTPFSRMTLKEKMVFIIRYILGFDENGVKHRRRKTERFVKTKLNLTSFSFYLWDQMIGRNLDIDLIVVGSDQVWNGTYNDPRPYLLEGAPTCSAISYAASFGMRALPDELREVYRKGFARFKAISCREAEGVKLVKNEGFDATHVVDPTILMYPETWMQLADNTRFKRKTLVCYLLSENILMQLRTLSRFAKKNKCNVKIFVDGWWRIPAPRNWAGLKQWLSVYVTRFFGNIHICMAAGPQEFLDAHASAEWIITDSFHSLMFSSIFSKNVRLLRPSSEGRKKMFARIEEFTAENVTGDSIVDDLSSALNSFEHGETISFEQQKIARLRNQSRSWLNSKLQTLNSKL